MRCARALPCSPDSGVGIQKVHGCVALVIQHLGGGRGKRASREGRAVYVVLITFPSYQLEAS